MHHECQLIYGRMIGVFRTSSYLLLAVALAGCTGIFAERDRNRATDAGRPAVAAAGPDTARPEARPETRSAEARFQPGAGARTADALDTTTAAQRVAAVAPPSVAGQRLGQTTASLGDPSDTGFWLRTGLVESARQGRVLHEPSGASVRLELRPSGSPPGAGSQLSLPAFRALGLDITALPDLVVFVE